MHQDKKSTPLISYPYPLSIEKGNSFESTIFNIIPSVLPYKSTAKYIWDIDSNISLNEDQKENQTIVRTSPAI